LSPRTRSEGLRPSDSLTPSLAGTPCRTPLRRGAPVARLNGALEPRRYARTLSKTQVACAKSLERAAVCRNYVRVD
jgi:hypothetical protein